MAEAAYAANLCGFNSDAIFRNHSTPQEPIDSWAGPGDTAEMTRNDVTALEVRVHAGGRGVLIVSEVFYPGWEARVNGHAATIYRVDGILRGVSVPNDDSVVRLEYRPRSVRIGFVLTLAGIAGTVLLGFVSRSAGTA
jgi:uncharacterized membrane protein YfhO